MEKNKEIRCTNITQIIKFLQNGGRPLRVAAENNILVAYFPNDDLHKELLWKWLSWELV